MRKNYLKTPLALAFLVLSFGLGTGADLSHAAEMFTTTGSAGEKVYTDKPARDATRVTVQYQSVQNSEAAQAGTEAGGDMSLSEMTPCERAQYIVAQYNEAEVLAEKDADGNTRILDETEASAAIERARADEERLCGEQDDA